MAAIIWSCWGSVIGRAAKKAEPEGTGALVLSVHLTTGRTVLCWLVKWRVAHLTGSPSSREEFETGLKRKGGMASGEMVTSLTSSWVLMAVGIEGERNLKFLGVVSGWTGRQTVISRSASGLSRKNLVTVARQSGEKSGGGKRQRS